jgi:hypothetical protein
LVINLFCISPMTRVNFSALFDTTIVKIRVI